MCFWVEEEEEDGEGNVKCRVITDGSDDRPLYLSFSLSLSDEIVVDLWQMSVKASPALSLSVSYQR